MDYLQIRELYHSGIKGMKWGIRRYQNYDGTLTEEGRHRYNKNYDDDRAEGSLPTKDEDGNYYYTNKKGKKTLYKTRSDQLSDEELTDLNKRVQQENKLAAETSSAYDPPEYTGPKADQALRDASRMAKDIADALPKGNGKVIKKDYSYLSDQELRDKINRLQLEDNYGRLTGDTKYVKSGSEKIREILQTTGSVLAIAGSAVGLAYTISKIREGNNTNTAKHSDILDVDNFLEHHGILGQKWGLRRYQNDDGTLTEAGRLRYGGKTHVDELDEDELNDLHAAREYQHKKKLAIGIGLGVGAVAATTVGAIWLAKRRSASNIMQKPVNDLPDNDEIKSNINANKKSLFGKKSPFGKKSSNHKDTIIDATFEDVKNNFGSASSPHATKGEKWGTRPRQETERPHATKGRKWGTRPNNARDTINAEVVDDSVKSMFGQKALNTKGTIIDATINDVTNNYKQTGQNNLGSRTVGLLSSKSGQSSDMLSLPLPGPKAKAVTDKDINGLIAKIGDNNLTRTETSNTIRPRGVSAKSNAPQSVKDRLSTYKDSQKTRSSSVYVKNGALYKYRNGKEILVNGGADSRYEYTTNSSGQILRTVKKNFKPSWLRHYDDSDYLVFREMYLSSFDTLAHHGIKGQKWGVRRYQDQNGNMTAEGKQRYRTNQGTKEIIDNSDTYSKLVGQNKRRYVSYGKSSGAKRGFLIGLGTGAAAGAGKTIFETALNRNKLGSGEYTTNRVINRFVRNTILGAFGGSVVGTLFGSVAGKKSSQAKLADKGQAYTNELLNTPIDRIARRR